jgi:hypothetical protein
VRFSMTGVSIQLSHVVSSSKLEIHPRRYVVWPLAPLPTLTLLGLYMRLQ